MTVLAALAAVGVSGYWLAGAYRSAPPKATAGPSTTGQPAVVAANGEGTYTIDAAVYRERGGAELRLQPNDSVRPGDRLSLEVRASTPTHVYVVNEDDRGASYLLFPLPGQKLTNPLPAGSPIRLPGRRDGAMLYWQVTSAGGREHFLIFVSPEPVTAFEKMFAGLPRPELHTPVVSAPLSGEALGLLRGVGGLVARPAGRTGAGLSEQVTAQLAATTETARGLWVRQITFDNPSR